MYDWPDIRNIHAHAQRNRRDDDAAVGVEVGEVFEDDLFIGGPYVCIEPPDNLARAKPFSNIYGEEGIASRLYLARRQAVLLSR